MKVRTQPAWAGTGEDREGEGEGGGAAAAAAVRSHNLSELSVDEETRVEASRNLT